MKMKLKKLFLLIFSIVFCFLITSCNFSYNNIFQPKRYTTIFYGIISYEEFHGGLCVNIPNVGLCTIPEAEKTYSCIGGELNDSYELQSGDLVKITFNHETESLAIAESYPGQFVNRATSIVTYAQNVSFDYLQSIDYIDAVWSFTQKRTDIFNDSKIGDAVYFIENGGKDGVAYKKLYSSAKIGKLDENTVSFFFSSSNNVAIEDFLKNYPILEQSTDWNFN